MKYIFPLLFLFPIAGLTQISAAKEVAPEVVVGKVRKLGVFATLYYRIVEEDTLYTLMYENKRYQSITDIDAVTFSGTSGTVDQLYEMLKSPFTEDNKKKKDFKIQFTLGEDNILVSSTKSLGVWWITVWVNGISYFSMNEGHVDELFGKKAK